MHPSKLTFPKVVPLRQVNQANRLRRVAEAQRFVCDQQREQWRQRLRELRGRIDRALLDATADEKTE